MKKKLPIIFLIDSSGSMAGDKITTLNNSIRNMLISLSDIEEYNICVSLISYATDAHLVYDSIDLHSFQWSDILAEGKSNFAEALILLSKVIEKIDFENSLYPEIIIISDGAPTDHLKIDNVVNDLLDNPVAKWSNYHSIFIGDDDGVYFLKEFIKKVNANRKSELFEPYNTMYIKDFFNYLEIIKEN